MIEIRRRISVAATMLFLAAALFMPNAVDAGDASVAVAPAGTAMYAETSDLASLERAILFMTNAMAPNAGAAMAGPGLDELFRSIQGSGQLPPMADPLVQQFFGLPGFDMDRSRGVLLALLIPQDDDNTRSKDLSLAVWLPVKSYAQNIRGVREGAPEWSHIKELPDHPNVFAIDYAKWGIRQMYMKGNAGGVFLSPTLWGLKRAETMWANAGAALPTGAGFTMRLSMNFTAPGAEEGLVAMIESPTNAMINRLRAGGGRRIADFTVRGLLHAMRQSTSLVAVLRFGSGGSVTSEIDLRAKSGGELAQFLGDSANASLTPRLVQAMPTNLSFLFACASGGGVRGMLSGYLSDFLAEAGDTRESVAAERIKDIVRGVTMLLNAAGGDVTAAITFDGDGLAAFKAKDPAGANAFASFMNARGGNSAVRTRGNDVLLGLGGRAHVVADAMDAALLNPDEAEPLRTDVKQLFDSMNGKGLFVAALYPADAVRLLLTYKVKETYVKAGRIDENNPMDMFAAAYMGKMVRSMDGMKPARHAITVGAVAPSPTLLRIQAGFSLLAMSEIMGVYQTFITALMPGAPGS